MVVIYFHDLSFIPLRFQEKATNGDAEPTQEEEAPKKEKEEEEDEDGIWA